MATSASAAIALGLVAAGALGGCVSTQEKNERAKLRATRVLESRERPAQVRIRNADVTVTAVSVIRQRARTAVTVQLANRAATPATDVPIAVGVRGPGGRRIVLNARKGLAWFRTHVPSIAAGGHATWVFAGRRRVPAASRPFARVGVPPSLSRAGALPRIAASHVAPSGRRAVTVRVENASDVPQYDLPVFAAGRSGAGLAQIEHLGSREQRVVRVPLVGRASPLPTVHVSPTIFE